MPLFHCSNCHHEFEEVKIVEKDGIEGYVLCDWCGSTAYILEDETPLEKMLSDGVNKLLEKLNENRSDINCSRK